MSRATASLRSMPTGQRLLSCTHSAEIWLDTEMQDLICVRKGALRVDCVCAGGERHFVTLVLEDELIGPWLRPEAGACYVLTALTRTVLECRTVPEQAAELYLNSLSAMARRAARLSALVRGNAADRVMGLLTLLTGDRREATPIELPTRKNLADMTALTIETVSRTITRLRKDGVLRPRRSKSARVNGAFMLHRPDLPEASRDRLGMAA